MPRTGGQAPAHLRTCLGCRGRDPFDQLLRFVQNSQKNGIVFDARRALPGRGIYSHPTQSCLFQAQRRVQASLRLVHPVDLDGVGVVLMSSIDLIPR